MRTFKHWSWLMSLLVVLVLPGCKQESAKKPQAASDDSDNSFNDNTLYNGNNNAIQTDPYQTSTYNGSGIVVEVNGSTNTNLTVALNQNTIWNFTARNSSGTAAQITRIVAQPQPMSMQITGSSVNFRPTQNQDLNGSLTVYVADNSNTSANQTIQSNQTMNTYGNETPHQFSWSQNGFGTGVSSSNSNGFLAAMVAILPQLLGGNFNLGTLATTALPAMAGQTTYGTNNFGYQQPFNNGSNIYGNYQPNNFGNAMPQTYQQQTFPQQTYTQQNNLQTGYTNQQPSNYYGTNVPSSNLMGVGE